MVEHGALYLSLVLGYCPVKLSLNLSLLPVVNLGIGRIFLRILVQLLELLLSLCLRILNCELIASCSGTDSLVLKIYITACNIINLDD